MWAAKPALTSSLVAVSGVPVADAEIVATRRTARLPASGSHGIDRTTSTTPGNSETAGAVPRLARTLRPAVQRRLGSDSSTAASANRLETVLDQVAATGHAGMKEQSFLAIGSDGDYLPVALALLNGPTATIHCAEPDGIHRQSASVRCLLLDDEKNAPLNPPA